MLLTLSFLEEINHEFPYFQTSKAIYLKSLKENEDIKFKKKLRLTAAYTRDRKILFDLITKSQNQNEKVVNVDNDKVLYYKKVIQPTSQEITKHQKYLKTNLKKNFF